MIFYLPVENKIILFEDNGLGYGHIYDGTDKMCIAMERNGKILTDYKFLPNEELFLLEEEL